MPRDLDPIRDLASAGIHLRHAGDRHKLACPRCQHTRVKHRSDKPLYVLLKRAEGVAIWKCFHCPFRGSTDKARAWDFDREWTAAGRAARSRQQKFAQGQQWRARFKEGGSIDAAAQPPPQGIDRPRAGRRGAGDEWRRKFRHV